MKALVVEPKVEPEVKPAGSLRRINRDEWRRMGEAGLFLDERLELLYGYIVEMSPIGAAHSFAVDLLVELLVRRVDQRGRVRVQNPFAAADDSQPEPDIAVVPRLDYRAAHPREAYLIIEIAESSLAFDRDLKAKLYAASLVPEYWVVNLRDALVEVHTAIAGDAYTRVTPYRRGERIRLLQLPDVEIAVEEFLPAPAP